MSGVTVEIIDGFEKHEDFDILKGSSNSPAKEDDLPELTGRWTMLLIDNIWRFVNPNRCWNMINDVSSMHDDGTNADTEMASCNEQCFFIDPEEAIYFYFPKDPRWQLLARPVSKSEFLQMAFLRPTFFEYGLELQSHACCAIEDIKSYVDISFTLSNRRGLHFGYELTMLVQNSSHSPRTIEWLEELDGVLLDRYVLLHQEISTLHCSINFPKTGQYRLDILGRRCINSQYGVDTDDYNFDVLCTHLLTCVEASRAGHLELPLNLRQEWGPGADIKNAAVHPLSHKGAIINAEENGEIDVRFRSTRNIEVLFELRVNGEQRHKATKAETVHKDIIIKSKLSSHGKYALDIYLKEKDRGVLFPLVCVYLVKWEPKKEQTIVCDIKENDLPVVDIPNVLCSWDVKETMKIEYDDSNYFKDLQEWQNSCMPPEKRCSVPKPACTNPSGYLKATPPVFKNRTNNIKNIYTPANVRKTKKRLSRLKALDESDSEQQNKITHNMSTVKSVKKGGANKGIAHTKQLVKRAKHQENKAPPTATQHSSKHDIGKPAANGELAKAHSKNFVHTKSKPSITRKKINLGKEQDPKIQPFVCEDTSDDTASIVWTDSEFEDDLEEELQQLQAPLSEMEPRRGCNRLSLLGSPLAIRRSRSCERTPPKHVNNIRRRSSSPLVRGAKRSSILVNNFIAASPESKAICKLTNIKI